MDQFLHTPRPASCFNDRPRLIVVRYAFLLTSLLFVGAFTALGAPSKAAAKHTAAKAPATPWRIVKIGSHDYLTVENIAEFYGLPTGVEPTEKTIRIENDKGSLVFTLGSRDFQINGVRNWLSFPVIEKGGKFLISRMDLA